MEFESSIIVLVGFLARMHLRLYPRRGKHQQRSFYGMIDANDDEPPLPSSKKSVAVRR